MKTYPQVIAPGVAIIGYYKPDIFHASAIAQNLVGMTVINGLEQSGSGAWDNAEWSSDLLAAEVRSPANHAFVVANGRSTEWHNDGGLPDMAMVVWSNREQTEVRLKDGTILRADPGDVMLINNSIVEHRTPPKLSEDRWFFRRYVKVPDWMQIAR